jgi:hypothetical protein
MAARIAIDFEALGAHARTLEHLADDNRWPLGVHVEPPLDSGAFGLMFANVAPSVHLVGEALRATINDIADAIDATAGKIWDVSSSFTAVEEAATAGLEQLTSAAPGVTFLDGVSTTSDLVAPVTESTRWWHGLGVIEDGIELASAIESGSWSDGVLAGTMGAIDAAATISDPIGTVIALGMGWTLEHMDPLATWYDQLTGDRDRVSAYARTWAAIGDRLDDVGLDVQHAVRSVSDDFAGSTADAYAEYQRNLVDHIRAAATWAHAFAAGVEVLSTVIGAVHDFVRDLLCGLIGSAQVWMLELALSFGAASPLVAEQIATRVTALAARALKVIARLTDAVADFLRLLGRLEDLAGSLSTALRKLHADDTGSVQLPGGRRPEPRGQSSEPSKTAAVRGSGRGARFRSAQRREDHVGRHLQDFPGLSAREYQIQADDFATGARDSATLELTRVVKDGWRHDHVGDVVRYNPQTNEFSVAKGDVIRSYYLPTAADGIKYFRKQRWPAGSPERAAFERGELEWE